jgi:hypothetical protein
MGEPGDLVLDRVYDSLGGVSDADHRDPRTEVDQGVAVDVDDDTAAGGRNVYRQDRADAPGHGGFPAGCELN